MQADSSWPNTSISLLAAARDGDAAALGRLMHRYWKPVYWYLRRAGRTHDDAADLAQDFFLICLRRKLFERADLTRGRLRAFLLHSLENAMKNDWRNQRAACRRPPGGLLSLEDLLAKEDMKFQPEERASPAEAFSQSWAREQILRALRLLEQEFEMKGMQNHFRLFRLCVIEPALDGKQAPDRKGLAAQFELTEKDVANRLMTARRAYQRLLREDIRSLATSDEEVADELGDLWKFLGSG